jgi:predicted metal-dependent hydrolase
METYDPRYLAGILLFNQQDYFEAHEVWEDLWSESHGNQRRFYQGLLQAAVGLCHYSNGNLGGAMKLYRSSRDYLAACGPVFQGLDLTEFWRQMDICYAPLLNQANPDRSLRLDPERVPTIALDSPPDCWPDPDEYLTEHE